MTRIPDKAEHRRRWAAIPMQDRRRIMKAVNRGQGMDARPEALLGVGVARQQQRFWSKAWLLGPLISLVFIGQGVTAVLANAFVASVIMGAMSFYWYRRARTAEAANLDRLGISTEEARRDRGSARDHAVEDEDDGDGRAGMPHAENPPKRSRKKRRRG